MNTKGLMADAVSVKVGRTDVPKELQRDSICLPDIPESEVIRYYTKLASMNFGTDSGPYPLGSCTMKYNPKYADRIASFDTFTDIHPYQDESTTQGMLAIMYDMERMLSRIAGMDSVTLQPAAGAHGEHTSMLIATTEIHSDEDHDLLVNAMKEVLS